MLKRFLLLAAFMLMWAFLPLLALADVQPLPYIVQAMNRCPLANCSMVAGGTSQVVLKANQGRKVFCIGNPSSATEDLFFDFGQAANTSNPISMDVPVGQQICMGGPLLYQGAIQVNAASTGHSFVVFEGQ